MTILIATLESFISKGQVNNLDDALKSATTGTLNGLSSELIEHAKQYDNSGLGWCIAECFVNARRMDLIKYFAQPQCEGDDFIYTCFYAACNAGVTDLLDQLYGLLGEPDLNSLSTKGKTQATLGEWAAHNAVMSGHIEPLIWLKAKGVILPDVGWTECTRRWAVENSGRLDILIFLQKWKPCKDWAPIIEAATREKYDYILKWIKNVQ